MRAFEGKTVMVTGGGTGIGLAVARRFASEGASVIILGRRKAPLEEAAASLREAAGEAGCGGTVRTFDGVDVANGDAVSAMFDNLEGSGVSLDVLVNNAGVSGPVMCFASDDLSEFADTVAIHLTGTFWTSREALRIMRAGSKIVTISTFFTEERPLEQRPYRFRSPYTASQGAKNRLAEALAWELHGRGISSIATNPGPVHSDRIYKTVYPKAAAEFMRVGGFESLDPASVRRACSLILPLLGEGEQAVREGLDRAAAELRSCGGGGGGDADLPAPDPALLGRLLSRVQEVAEKIQANTAGMIADRQFLSQDQVAATVAALSGDELSAVLSGKVIPGDRVFYPVKAHVGGAPPAAPAPSFSGSPVVFTVGAANGEDAAYGAALAAHAEKRGAVAVCILRAWAPDAVRSAFSEFHTHEADLSDAAALDRWLAAAASNFGPVAAAVHLTGNVPDAGVPLSSLGRAEWDALVRRFILEPATAAHRALAHFVPGGGDDPRLFRGASGRAVIVGPALPAGRKVPGDTRARAEVFRGALRPLAATVNQELSDVLKSDARVFAALPGSPDGAEPDGARMAAAFDYFVSPESASSAQVAFCVDEARRRSG